MLLRNRHCHSDVKVMLLQHSMGCITYIMIGNFSLSLVHIDRLPLSDCLSGLYMWGSQVSLHYCNPLSVERVPCSSDFTWPGTDSKIQELQEICCRNIGDTGRIY